MTDNLTGNWSHVHRARKERTEQRDLPYKNRIMLILRKHFDLVALGLVDEYHYLCHKTTGEILIGQSFQMTKQAIFSNYHVNRIDLLVKQHTPMIIIEIDGLDHGFFDDITATQQTIDRNENYARGGYTQEKKTLVIVTTRDLEGDDESLITLLEYKLGMNRLDK